MEAKTLSMVFKVLAYRLEDSEDDIDIYLDGELDKAVKYAIQETKQAIGREILEIMSMPVKDLQQELHNYPRK